MSATITSADGSRRDKFICAECVAELAEVPVVSARAWAALAQHASAACAAEGVTQ